ncbi:MAG: thiol peroxidase [Caldilineales bacterium]|nr:thiol peroxidase [Caldilineales bacterium]MCW5858721.1 thiol peroxidase [Caldilineales bacterium]
MPERIITLAGHPISPVLGAPVRVGDPAPAAAGRTNVFGVDSFDVLADTAGKVRVLNFVPSLNTSICSAQTKRFNEALAGDEGVAVVTISADLPAMQRSWCATAGLENALMVSDAFDMAIGSAYGTYIRDIRLDQRAVVVVDREDVVRHAEYCSDIDMHPDYQAALAAVKSLL